MELESSTVIEKSSRQSVSVFMDSFQYNDQVSFWIRGRTFTVTSPPPRRRPPISRKAQSPIPQSTTFPSLQSTRPPSVSRRPSLGIPSHDSDEEGVSTGWTFGVGYSFLDVMDRVVCFDVQGSCFAGKCLDEDLH